MSIESQNTAKESSDSVSNDNAIIVELVTEQQFAELREDWNKLLQTSSASSVFLTWEWAYSWWQNFGKQEQLCLAVARKNNLIVGIGPFAIRHIMIAGLVPVRRLVFLGATGASGEYLDIICDPVLEKDVTNAIFGFLASSVRWDETELTDLLPSSALFSYADEIQATLGLDLEKTNAQICPYIDLSPSLEDVIGGIKPRLWKNVRYCTRRLEREFDVTIQYVTEVGELQEAMDDFFTLHSSRWAERGNPGSFQQEKKRSFYRQIAQLTLNQRWLRLYRLHVDGQCVATLFGFQYGNVFFYLQAGFNPEWKKYSVGQVLIGRILRDLVTDGVDRFDFLRGPEDYKYDWGASDRATHTLRLRQRGFKGFVSQQMESGTNAMRSLLRRVKNR